MTEKPLSLVKKLARITSEMKKVPKNGFNRHDGYPYATDGDVFSAVNEACEKYDVFLSWDNKPETVSITEFQTGKGTTWLRYRFDAVLTLMDGDSDTTIATNWMCIANDMSDKGFGKALTLGLKYALKTTFKIDTGEADPDGEPNVHNESRANNRNQNQRQQPPPQQQPAQQRQQPPKQEPAKKDPPKAAAAPPPEMEGRSFAALDKPLQKAVLKVYKGMAVDYKTTSLKAHEMVIQAVHIALDGEPMDIPRWWDEFTAEEVEEFVANRFVATAAANYTADSDPKVRMETKIREILRLTGWDGNEPVTPEDMDRSLLSAANALQVPIEEAHTSWSLYDEPTIDLILGKLNGTA